MIRSIEDMAEMLTPDGQILMPENTENLLHIRSREHFNTVMQKKRLSSSAHSKNIPNIPDF